MNFDSNNPARFDTTQWTVVLRAGASHEDSEVARQALGTLFESYSYPLYAFLRREGNNHHDASDLIQGFFLHLLEKQSLATADAERGRFRSFLIAALKRYARDEWRKQQAEKRGGGIAPLSLDLDAHAERFVHEPGHTHTPERLFERAWAVELLDRSYRALALAYADEDHAALFDALAPGISPGAGHKPYAEIASDLGLSEGAVKTAVHRLRKRYRDLLREQVAATVDDPGEVDEELAFLKRCFARG